MNCKWKKKTGSRVYINVYGIMMLLDLALLYNMNLNQEKNNGKLFLALKK